MVFVLHRMLTVADDRVHNRMVRVAATTKEDARLADVPKSIR
jgi:hypothetical protein